MSRHAPLDLSPDQFRALGHALVERIAAHYDALPLGPVTPGETPNQVRAALGQRPLPEQGADPQVVLDDAARLLFEHSLYNGHPRFFGYITSSAAPLGALGDLLAAAVNPNCGGFSLSPMATEIERQSVRWIAELIGYPAAADGLLVSGGNMANFVCFLAARRARAPWNVREDGVAPVGRGALRAYASSETHTWVQKACDLFGLGTNALRWIPVDGMQRMQMGALRAAIAEDRSRGGVPFLVVGSAGTISTGAVDPLREIAALCREQEIWFHADGAYGALAAALPDASPDLRALSLADSVAVDPHKWLYAPLEAGCALVREPGRLQDTFAYLPPYYRFSDLDEAPVNFFALGPQNSRGFRALKIWLQLRQVGREGYVKMIADDVRLARRLFDRAAAHPRLEALTYNLSIATFRYLPEGVSDPAEVDAFNEELLARLQKGGRAFLSNAVVDGRFALRACIVNFRTDERDVDAVPELVAEIGGSLHVSRQSGAPAPDGRG